MGRPIILIIDSPGNILSIRDFLNKKSVEWDIVETSDIQFARRLLENEDVSAVICGSDIQGISCISFSEEIAKQFSADINVILFNMNGNKIKREEFLKSAAFDLIQKEPFIPIRGDEIVESVEVAVAAKRMRSTGSFKRELFLGGRK